MSEVFRWPRTQGIRQHWQSSPHQHLTGPLMPLVALDVLDEVADVVDGGIVVADWVQMDGLLVVMVVLVVMDGCVSAVNRWV